MCSVSMQKQSALKFENVHMSYKNFKTIMDLLFTLFSFVIFGSDIFFSYYNTFNDF